MMCPTVLVIDMLTETVLFQLPVNYYVNSSND